MDFELSEDQLALRDGVRSFCDGRVTTPSLFAMASGAGFDRGLWSELGELGVFALRLDEADGGTGLGWTEAALVTEELGRALVPGPLVWTQLAAGFVDGAGSGERVVTGLRRDDPSRMVEHPSAVDVVIMVDDRGWWAVEPAAFELEPIATPTDPLTPAARCTGQVPEGVRVCDAATAAALWQAGGLLNAALHVGYAAAATERAVAYAGEREQFGRPVGSFQALKHLMADMVVHVELARAAVHAAAVGLDGRGSDPVERSVLSARIAAEAAARVVTEANIQVHGGMGYTWEVDAHLFVKRAMVTAAAFGSTDEAAERLAELIG